MSPPLDDGDDEHERDAALDPQARALLDELDASTFPPGYAVSVETGREVLRDLFITDDDPEPVGSVEDFAIDGPGGELPVRAYRPEGAGPHPALVFVHGGGWVRGDLDTHDGDCRALANRAECAVFSIEYRRAPEHPFPAAFEDAYAAVEWVAEHAEAIGVDPQQVAIGGDSAGGNLSAAVALAARDRDGPDLAHQLLIYPAVNAPTLRWMDSYEENGEGYFLEYESIEWYYDRYLDSWADHRNAYAFPLEARDLSGVAPATVLTAGFDPLIDEGIAYADRLREAGVATEHLHYPGMIHGFVSLPQYFDRASDARDALGAELAAAFDR